MSIQSLLSDPKNIFLDTSLQDFPEGSIEHKILEIFSYGTWSDYKAIEEDVPLDLKIIPGSIAEKKLKQLTILSLCAGHSEISCQELIEATELGNIASLEDLIIELISHKLFIGKIDEQDQKLIIHRVASRCVKQDKESVGLILRKIREMRERIVMATQ